MSLVQAICVLVFPIAAQIIYLHSADDVMLLLIPSHTFLHTLGVFTGTTR